jgi:hypothetical protein
LNVSVIAAKNQGLANTWLSVDSTKEIRASIV